MKIVLSILFAVVSANADLAPWLTRDDNICPEALIDEVIGTGKARVDVIKRLVTQSTKKNPNCVSETQGIHWLCYMADYYHNNEFLQVLEQIEFDVNFQNITALYNNKKKAWDPRYRGDFPLLCNAQSNDYIASDTQVFYLLDHGANPNLQEDRHGTTALISVADEGNHFNTVDPRGQFESSTEYRKLMFLRLFGANPNLQGWNRPGDTTFPENYAVNVFHRLARNRTGVEILSPFQLLIEPEKYLTYEHFWAQIPKSYTHKNIRLDRAKFEELKAKMPKYDPKTLCQKAGNGKTVWEDLESTPGVHWDKTKVIRYLKQFGNCSDE